MSDKKYTSIKHDNAAGRVDFQGGKAVWHWAENSNDSTSILIKSLENPELELEVTQRTPIPARKAKAAAAGKAERKAARRDADDPDWNLAGSRSGGFDPYNRS